MSIAKEAVAAQVTTQVAIAYLASVAYLELVRLWSEVGVGGTSATVRAATFVARAGKVLSLRSAQAAQITLTNERLQRAIRTGRVLRLPDVDGVLFAADPVLGDVRREFIEAVEAYAPEALKPSPQLPPLPRMARPAAPSEELLRDYIPYSPEVAPPSLNGKKLKLDEDPELVQELRQQADDLKRATDKALRSLAAANLKTLKADPEKEDSVLSRTGRFAWSATRARSARLSATIARRDTLVVGYIRVHYGFNGEGPCALCAALLSRGAVYKTAERAGGDVGSVYQYHPNCRCQAVAIYKNEGDWKGDERFKANTFYQNLWKSQVSDKGLSGQDAQRAWRRLIDAMNRGHWKPGASDDN